MNPKTLFPLTGATRKKIAEIALLLLDVDGVLTQGSIVYTDHGEEIKTFSVKDGLGIRLLMDSGVEVGIITGRRSGALSARCRNLGIDLLYDGIKGSKTKALSPILEERKISRSQVAFVGDDLPDLSVMASCGVSFAVADAVEEVRAEADFITRNNGGEGAVREICEGILKARELWPDIVERFYGR